MPRNVFRINKGSKSYWRTIVIAIMAWFSTRSTKESQKLNKRTNVVRELESGLELYSDITKSWLIKAIKHPLISIFSDTTLNLGIVNPSIDYSEMQNRLMKLNARIKGIFKDILESTNSGAIP
jgi:hypothetical protein